MPSFNAFGQWCSGTTGMGTYYGHIEPNGDIIGRHLWSGSGGTQWLVNRILCANYWQDPPNRMAAYNTITGHPSNITSRIFGKLSTSKLGQWVGFDASFGVLDWLNRSFPESYTDFNSMGPDGSYCIKRRYDSEGGWDLLFSDGTRVSITSDDMYQITNLGNGMIAWTNIDGSMSHSMNMPVYNPIAFPIWKPRMIQIGTRYWQLYGCPLGCFFHPVDSTLGYKIGEPGDYFGLDAYINGNDVQIIWALTEGEVLSDIRAKVFELSDERINLKDTQVPIPENTMRIRAFERPMWQSPYYSFHQRYPYNNDVIDMPLDEYLQYGNAITVIGDEQDPDIRNTELIRLSKLGRPLIVDIGTHEPDRIYENLTIAWLAAGGNINQLVDNVTKAKGYFEKPVISYLDGDGWPDHNPFPENVWPAVQAYRFPNESIIAFRDRITTIIERVNSYGLPMVLTTRFDDWTGSQGGPVPIQQTLDCMMYYDFWLAVYNFVGHMPFADRRGKGIAHYPALNDWAIAFNFASIRPNRFDYWKPSSQDTKTVLINKFGQSRANPVLEKYLREDIIGRYL